MTDEEIKREAEKIELVELYSTEEVERTREAIVALCLRVRDEQREADAKVCEEIGSSLSPVGFGRKVINECAAAIRAAAGEGEAGRVGSVNVSAEFLCSYCESGDKPWQKNGVWLHAGGVVCSQRRAEREK